MMCSPRSLACALLVLAVHLLAPTAHAQIYVCTDSKGNTLYTDKPCATGVRSAVLPVDAPRQTQESRPDALPTLPRYEDVFGPLKTIDLSPKAVPPKPSKFDLLPKEEQDKIDRKIAEEDERNRCKAGLFGQYYQDCILDRIPSAKNRIAAGAVIQSCEKDAPCRYSGRKRTGIVSNTTAAECFKKRGYDVTEVLVAASIRAACYDLYPDD